MIKSDVKIIRDVSSRANNLFNPLIRRLGVLAACTVLANIISLLAIILFARAMGPSNFGIYYLAISLINIFIIPVALGLGASIVQQISSGASSAHVLGASFICAIGYLVLLLILGFLFYENNTVSFFAFKNIFISLVGFGILTILGVIFDSYLRSLRKTKALGLIRLCAAGLNLLTAIVLISMRVTGPAEPLNTRIIELMAFIILASFFIRRISWPDLNTMKNLLRYALPATISVAGLAIFVSSDKFLIAKLLNFSETGKYSIAFFLSYTLVSRGVDIVLAIFFPEVVSHNDKAAVADRLNNMTPKILMIFTPALVLVMWLVTTYLGDEYMLGIWRTIFFSLGGVLFFIAHLHWWMICSVGSRGVWWFALFSLLSSALVVVLDLMFVKQFGLDGALGALLAGTLFLFISGNMALLRLSRGKWIL